MEIRDWYKPIYYHETEEAVALGDRVSVRVFFSRKQGQVIYVPGISQMNPAIDFGGLRSVVIRVDNGPFVATGVHPETNKLKKSVRLEGRGPLSVPELKPDEDPFDE